MSETETDRAQAAREKQLHTLDRLAKSFGQSLTQALGGPLGAGRQLDGLLGTLTTKLSSLALKAALAPVKTGITGLVKGALSAAVAGGTETFARGGVVARGRVQPFAAGGIVAAPTYFPMRGGHGLMGEAGPEARQRRPPRGRGRRRAPGTERHRPHHHPRHRRLPPLRSPGRRRPRPRRGAGTAGIVRRFFANRCRTLKVAAKPTSQRRPPKALGHRRGAGQCSLSWEAGRVQMNRDGPPLLFGRGLG